MSQQNQNNATDTTFTKTFVGGLAWQTRSQGLRSFFEQFGEVVESLVICERPSGRSKGYGFVTFREADSARRACHNPTPVIDGRTTNCNLAYIRARRNDQINQTGTRYNAPMHFPNASMYVPSQIPNNPYIYPYYQWYPHIPQLHYIQNYYSVSNYGIHQSWIYTNNHQLNSLNQNRSIRRIKLTDPNWNIVQIRPSDQDPSTRKDDSNALDKDIGQGGERSRRSYYG